MSNPHGERRIFSVSQLNRYAKRLLEADALLAGVFLEGEISNFNSHASGHLYFSLKDAAAAMSAVMFAGHAASLKFVPKSGMKITAFGHISLYEKTGQYQFYAEFMEPAGVGAAQLAFTQLCEKLRAEGLFDNERKRHLPMYAHCVAVITSPTGAAIRDIIATARTRNPAVRLVLAPALVQGEAAAADLVRALGEVNAWGGADVIILGRGGGSAEDLAAFNDEGLAREVAASSTPVISAVGHETDFAVTDFAADVRAATPTAAAQMAVADARELKTRVKGLTLDLFISAREAITTRHTHAKALTQRLSRHIQTRLAHEAQALSHRHAMLEKLSPHAAFARGLAFVRDESNVPVTSASAVKTGETLTLHWADGTVRTQVL